MKIRYLSHAAFQLTTSSGKVILIDPFITGNPTCTVSLNEITADYIVLSHGHGDHVGDTLEIAKKHGALVIAVFELANILEAEGARTHGMHIGGAYQFEGVKIKFTIAHHGGSYKDGRYSGEPAGILIYADGKTVYHTGDTGLFLDMKLIGERNAVDVMMVPIGDNYTMGADDAVEAARFVKPGLVIPMHYNTFPVINADPYRFCEQLGSVGIIGKVLQYGEEASLD